MRKLQSIFIFYILLGFAGLALADTPFRAFELPAIPTGCFVKLYGVPRSVFQDEIKTNKATVINVTKKLVQLGARFSKDGYALYIVDRGILIACADRKTIDFVDLIID